jgi:hypothetical protein
MAIRQNPYNYKDIVAEGAEIKGFSCGIFEAARHFSRVEEPLDWHKL